MRHAMPFSVFVVTAICGGICTVLAASADEVTIAASGALHKVPVKARSVSPRRREDQPDSTPFELDNGQPAGLSDVPGTPFEADPSYTPFVLDDGTAPASGVPAQASSASAVQADVNDSPFVLDTTTKEPTRSRRPMTESPFVMEGEKDFAADAPPSPFITDAQAGASPFVVDTETQPSVAKAAVNAVKSKKSSTGSFTIVRNKDPRPGPQKPLPATTRMVMAYHGQTTTGQPTTSTGLHFELDGSMLEIAPGQAFVPIPNTPFEVDRHVAMSLAKQPQASIELLRPGVASAALLAQGSLERKVGDVMPHSVKSRLMRNDPDMELQPGFPIVAARPAELSEVASNKEDEVTDPHGAPGTSVNGEVEAIAANTPVFSRAGLPAGPIPATSDNGNSSLSAPAEIINTTIAAAANATNSTFGTHKPITTRGAIISIFLGLLVTIFFLSIVLCILHAGQKDTPEVEEKEPPRPTPSYRQQLRAQQQPDATETTIPAPSV